MLNEGAQLPEALLAHIPTREDLLQHGVEVDWARWRKLTAELGLSEPVGPFVGPGRTTVSRGDLLRMADSPITSTAAVQLFYASLAWGLGRKARSLANRLRPLGDAATQKRLAEAWSAVREGRSPEECYESLISQTGAGRIPFLGPAFATKFLYFATGTRQEPQCLVLDAVVATKLRSIAWPDSPTTRWWPSTYGRYCALLARWARESHSEDMPVAPDQLELALFRL